MNNHRCTVTPIPDTFALQPKTGKFGVLIFNLLLTVTGCCSLISVANADADVVDPFRAAFTGGKIHFDVRYRFEHVEDDRLSPGATPLKDVDASTLRTLLGYETGRFHDFAVTLDFVNVTKVGGSDFNDGSNGKTVYAAVADPSNTDAEQAFLSYTGLPATELKVGRQYITYRDAPFHRFIGTILWRQNWQTFDAFSLHNKTLPDTTVNYAYIWNVNRIFGEDAPDPLGNFDSDSHFVNIQYTGLPIGKVEGYAYLLDFDNAAAFSTQTYGLRFNGKQPLTEIISVLYTAEYANQSDYKSNPGDIDSDYFLGELGTNIKVGKILDNITLKFSYELLGGDGGVDRFVTILGTNHAFQGWADRFLVTPGDGIEDFYITAVAKILGATFIASYHNLNSDNLDYDYGDEIDLLLTKTFKEHYSLGIKYARYDADRNSVNIIQNGSNSTVTNDADIFWAWAEFKY